MFPSRPRIWGARLAAAAALLVSACGGSDWQRPRSALDPSDPGAPEAPPRPPPRPLAADLPPPAAPPSGDAGHHHHHHHAPEQAPEAQPPGAEEAR